MCYKCAIGQTPIFPLAVYKATQRMKQSTITKQNRINGIIVHEVSRSGYNLYKDHVEVFDEGSETWIASMIPPIVWYMESATEIVAFLEDYLSSERCNS